jgi:hypothetical protein
MTPYEFTEALDTIGWSKKHLARILGCDSNMPTRWARGEARIPDGLAVWLFGLAGYHKSVGVPEWRKR